MPAAKPNGPGTATSASNTCCSSWPSRTAPATRQLLAEHGVTLDRARDAVWLVVGSGRGDGPRFDSATLLATLGIDLDQIRRQVERQFGPDAIHRLYASEAGWNLRPAARSATSRSRRT